MSTTDTLAAIPGLSAMSAAFKRGVIAIADDIGVDPDWLTSIMKFESNLDPHKVNPFSHAIGLIQFAEPDDVLKTRIGATKAELAAMTAEEQLGAVHHWFSPYKGRLHNLSDTYMAVFAPIGIGQGDDFHLYTAPSLSYTQNAALDKEKKGYITKADAASQPQGILNAAGDKRIAIDDGELGPLASIIVGIALTGIGIAFAIRHRLGG